MKKHDKDQLNELYRVQYLNGDFVTGEFDHHQIQSIFVKINPPNHLDHGHEFYRFKYQFLHLDHIQSHQQSELKH